MGLVYLELGELLYLTIPRNICSSLWFYVR